MNQFVRVSGSSSFCLRSVLYGAFIVCGCVASVMADSGDIGGGRDHPLVTRFPNSRIVEYRKNFNFIDMSVGQNEDGSAIKERLEGDLTRVRYYHNKADSQPSPFELLRNYQNALKTIGAEVVYERLPTDRDGGETTLKALVKDKEYFVHVSPEIYSAPTQSYLINVLERKPMQQVVSANNLLDELNAKGFVTLYINFDTNKWDLKADAVPTLKEVEKMLTSAPDVKVRIEGHTDSVGSAESNKTLSMNRAKSVMESMVASGIDSTRLTAVGFGQEKPVADNATESGRAKNRRVEIVKE